MKIDRARLFDLRVVQRNIRSGRVNKDDYGAYLTALPDSAPKIKPRDEGGDEDGYDGHPPALESYEDDEDDEDDDDEPALERSAAPQIAPVSATHEMIAPSIPTPSAMPAPAVAPPPAAAPAPAPFDPSDGDDSGPAAGG